MTTRPSWEKAAQAQFEQYVNTKTGEIFDAEFRREIDYLRKIGKNLDIVGDPANSYPSVLDIQLIYFGFSYGAKDFLRNYITNDVIDYSLVSSSLVLEADDGTIRTDLNPLDESRYKTFYANEAVVKVAIPAGTTVTEVREFITKHKDFINDKTAWAHLPKRKSPRYNSRRDARLKQLWKDGKTHSEIAHILSTEFTGVFDDSDIATMVQRLGLKREK